MKKNFKFIDLFAGLGGFHLALEQLGGECVFASELRADLQTLYKLNFPGSVIIGDILKYPIEKIPAHDVLCAGFPCQPFSQAGKRQGFSDEKERGNLFYVIKDILKFHKPKYFILENVSNLKGHDGGLTWFTIESSLKSVSDDLGYDVKEEILSPHQFGIPQHRKRIYIVGVRKDLGNLNDFVFPKFERKLSCDITKVIDNTDTRIQKLKPETRMQLEVWQEFIDNVIKSGDTIPTFPIWAMEFGATYPFKEKAPAFLSASTLSKYKGHLGKRIKGKSTSECLKFLPIYAQTDKDEIFPKWKIRYIEQNRDFYSRHKKWLDLWLEKVQDFDNSHLKLEWNCGNSEPKLYNKIIQFRASGIRVKLPTFSPALNLVGTQIPIFPWVPIPSVLLIEGEPSHGRYMTVKEAAAIQGMAKLNLNYWEKDYPLSHTRIFEALGNAVNVTIVKHIAQQLLKNE